MFIFVSYHRLHLECTVDWNTLNLIYRSYSKPTWASQEFTNALFTPQQIRRSNINLVGRDDFTCGPSARIKWTHMWRTIIILFTLQFNFVDNSTIIMYGDFLQNYSKVYFLNYEHTKCNHGCKY